MDRRTRADRDKPFLMPIEDVFSITGRTVATGRIELVLEILVMQLRSSVLVMRN